MILMIDPAAAKALFGFSSSQLATNMSLLEAVLLLLVLVVSGLVLALVYAVHTHSKEGRKYVSVQELQALSVPRDSLFRIFQSHLIPMDEISARGYSAALTLVQELIGIVPSCDMVLEIWKPAFECYNLIVPNFLNLPQLILPGYEIRDLVPLATYISSRANNCTYCTTHCCAFALRRGVDPTLIRNALEALLCKDGETMFTPRERAVIRVAYGLGTVPATLQRSDVEALKEELSADQIEWIVAACAMFGSFNKLMDGLAIPLERDSYAETRRHMDDHFVANPPASIGLDNAAAATTLPPLDDWTLPFAFIWQAIRPGGALALEAKLGKGIPTKSEDCLAYLSDLTGGAASFPVLVNLQHDRFRWSLTAILAKNLVSDGLSLRTKLLAGIQYCQILENPQLQSELQMILNNLATKDDAVPSDAHQSLILRVAQAISYNPSRMTAPLIDEIDASSVSAENIVELVSFLATLQALHRIEVYYQVAAETLQ